MITPMRRTDLLSSAGSQAATNEAGNKVVTVGRRTHVTWQDVTPEGYFNRVRTLDLDDGEWSRPARWAAPTTTTRGR